MSCSMDRSWGAGGRGGFQGMKGCAKLTSPVRKIQHKTQISLQGVM